LRSSHVYRAALRDLRKDRDFTAWLDYANALDTAQREAMRESGANNPVGKAFNAAIFRIFKRCRCHQSNWDLSAGAIVSRSGINPFSDCVATFRVVIG
jgi:hypothetical protein